MLGALSGKKHPIAMRPNSFDSELDHDHSETMQWCEPLLWDIVRSSYRAAGLADDRVAGAAMTDDLAALHVRCWSASLAGADEEAARVGARIDALADRLGVERALIEKVDARIAAEMNDVIVSRFRRGLYDRRRYCAALERAIANLRFDHPGSESAH